MPIGSAKTPAIPLGRTVLVVEDEAEIRSLIEELLHLEGFRTIPARDGNEAVSAAREFLPDAITLDLWMPNRDGHATLSELAADPATRQIPVVVVSAYADGQALTPQVCRVVAKPFDVDDLIRAVMKALARGRPNYQGQ